MLIETVKVDGVVPLAGVTDSQLDPLVTAAAAVTAVPLLETVKVWLGGAVPVIW